MVTCGSQSVKGQRVKGFKFKIFKLDESVYKRVRLAQHFVRCYGIKAKTEEKTKVVKLSAANIFHLVYLIIF